MPDHYNDPVDPNALAAQLNMIQGGNQGMFGLVPEFSASRGSYMPTDIGSLSKGYNVMQDQLDLLQNPLVLMMLGMTGGDQFGMVAADDGVTDGANYLNNVIAQYGQEGLSAEAFLADQILYEGKTPVQAVQALKEFSEEKITFDDGSESKRADAMFDNGFDQETWMTVASDYSEKLMNDRAPTMVEGEGAKLARSLGIDFSMPSLQEYNPKVGEASAKYDTARADYDKMVPAGGPKSLGAQIGAGVTKGGSPNYQNRPRSRQNLMDVLPKLAAARSGLQSETGAAAARRDIDIRRGVNPAQDQLRSMLGFLSGEARGS